MDARAFVCQPRIQPLGRVRSCDRKTLADLLQGSARARVSGGTWSAETDETRWVRAFLSSNRFGSVFRTSPIFAPPLRLVSQRQHVQPAEDGIRDHHLLYGCGHPLLHDHDPHTRCTSSSRGSDKAEISNWPGRRSTRCVRTPRKATIGLWRHQSITHCLFQDSYIRLYVTISPVLTVIVDCCTSMNPARRSCNTKYAIQKSESAIIL